MTSRTGFDVGRDVLEHGVVDVVDEVKRLARRQLEHLTAERGEAQEATSVAHRARVARQALVVKPTNAHHDSHSMVGAFNQNTRTYI